MVIRRVDVINQFIVLFHKRLICIWFVVVHPHTKGAQIIENFLTIYQSWHEIQVNDQSWENSSLELGYLDEIKWLRICCIYNPTK